MTMETNTENIHLDAITTHSGWKPCPDRPGRVEARSEPFRMLVETMPNGRALWFVEHDRYGVLQAWTVENSTGDAKVQAISFTRAYVLADN